MTPTPPKTVYRLVLEVQAGDVPPVVRLRGLLRVALRRFGLRAVEVAEVTAADGVGAKDDTGAGRR